MYASCASYPRNSKIPIFLNISSFCALFQQGATGIFIFRSNILDEAVSECPNGPKRSQWPKSPIDQVRAEIRKLGNSLKNRLLLIFSSKGRLESSLLVDWRNMSPFPAYQNALKRPNCRKCHLLKWPQKIKT